MAKIGGQAELEQEPGPPQPNVPSGSPGAPANRRAFPRHPVDCPVVVIPVAGAAQMGGQLTDLSMGGCLVRLQQRFLTPMFARVEVQFQLRGIAFRILGVTVGTRGAHRFAIRFLDIPARRRDELAEVLDEIAATPLPLEGAYIAEGSDPPEPPSSAPERPAEVANAIEPAEHDEALVNSGADLLPSPFPVVAALESGQGNFAEEMQSSADAVAPPGRNAPATAGRERRTHDRHQVGTSVKLLLIKAAIPMTGRIVNLSMGGCRIRTDERFQVGIFVRVEAEFYLHGLPFRIAGVSQAIQDRNTIGVRFLDMSQRCRAQLAELVAEIEAADNWEGCDTALEPRADLGSPGSQ